VKTIRQIAALASFFGGLIFSAHATFSSIYIFGDSLSATATNNATGAYKTNYYGGTLRYSNGRTWVEVLAQRQGLGANSITNVNWAYSSNNLSFYGNFSALLVTNVNRFSPPANATNCLFVLWVDNADFVGDISAITGTDQAAWINAVNQHLANHFSIITNLYAKGCRTLVAPNAADITTIPEFNNSGTAYCTFVRRQITSFNASYATMLQQICASSPGLTIYNPDIFSLLNNVLTNAASYGLTNALYDQGNGAGPQPIDAIDAYYYGLINSAALNGPGTNYIFWDGLGDPTAAMGEVIADFAQQCISPVQFSAIKQVNGSNRLDVVNMPVGLAGFVENSTNPVPGSWTSVTNFTSLTSAQSIFIPTPPLPAGFGSGLTNISGGVGDINPNDPSTNAPGTNSFFNSAGQFYRLRFPYSWNWP
jgi:phospholipase/lecithinase/hemolysin